MPEVDIQIRCQRCGTQMDMKDPGPGAPWTPEQFWVCARCGRHFWTTYPPPAPPKPAAAEAPAGSTAKPGAVTPAKPAEPAAADNAT